MITESSLWLADGAVCCFTVFAGMIAASMGDDVVVFGSDIEKRNNHFDVWGNSIFVVWVMSLVCCWICYEKLTRTAEGFTLPGTQRLIATILLMLMQVGGTLTNDSGVSPVDDGTDDWWFLAMLGMSLLGVLTVGCGILRLVWWGCCRCCQWGGRRAAGHRLPIPPRGPLATTWAMPPEPRAVPRPAAKANVKAAPSPARAAPGAGRARGSDLHAVHQRHEELVWRRSRPIEGDYHSMQRNNHEVHRGFPDDYPLD
jgi:hypothetical protein